MSGAFNTLNRGLPVTLSKGYIYTGDIFWIIRMDFITIQVRNIILDLILESKIRKYIWLISVTKLMPLIPDILP